MEQKRKDVQIKPLKNNEEKKIMFKDQTMYKGVTACHSLRKRIYFDLSEIHKLSENEYIPERKLEGTTEENNELQ